MATGTSRATAADQTHPTSTTGQACRIHILCSTQPHFTIFAHLIRRARRRIRRRPLPATPTRTRSASQGSGRWLTWPTRRARTNRQICRRTPAIHITRRVKSFRRWQLAVFIRCTIRTCGQSCIGTSTVRRPLIWPAILTKLQFSSLISERSAPRSRTTAFH